MQFIAPVPISLGEDESLPSVCSGLASLFGRTARDLCLDMAFSFQDVVDGRRNGLRRLAELTRINADVLTANAIVRIGPQRYTLGREFLVRGTLSRMVMRGCPHCLLEDIEGGGIPERRPYGRNAWLIAPLRTCARHGRALVELSHDGTPGLLHDFARLLKPVIPRLESLASEAPERRPSAFETALAGRLLDQPVSPFLDTLPFYAGARLCEIMGAVANHGAQVRLESLTDADWYEAGASGFAIVAPGEDTIRTFLSGLQSAARAGRHDWGPKAMFGRLWDWLAHESDDPAYDPVRDIIRRHVAETMPVGLGELILGREVTRRIHSVLSAAAEYGAHPKRLRKLLHAAGHISEADVDLNDERTLFDAEKARPFLEQVAGSLPLQQAGAYLNAPRPHERLLFEAGFIRPFILGGTRTLKDHAFARQDLDAFLGRLMARVSCENDSDGTLVSIPQAAKKANCSAMEIVGLLLDGRLTRVGRDPRVPGYLSMRVAPDEIKRLVRRPDHGGLSLREVEQRLGTSTRVVKGLIQHGHLPSRVEINPVNRCPRQVVRRKDLDAFMGRYVTLHVAAKEAGIHFRKLKSLLTSSGVALAFSPNDVHAAFYERKFLLRESG